MESQVFSHLKLFDKKKKKKKLNKKKSERNLQLTALLGGWVGGYFAIEKFKHKRKKQEFMIPYHIASVTNMGAIAFFATPKGRETIINRFPHIIKRFR